MWKIKKTVLEAVCAASQSTYPNEFIALLGGDKKKKIVEELIILPSEFGSHHSSIRMDLLPYTVNTVGSVHSHPSYSNKPSHQDKHFFGKEGEIHLIIRYPFSLHDIQAYDDKGKPIMAEAID